MPVLRQLPDRPRAWPVGMGVADRCSGLALPARERVRPTISASGVASLAPPTGPTSTPASPAARHPVAAAPKRVARSRSAAVGTPPAQDVAQLCDPHLEPKACLVRTEVSREGFGVVPCAFRHDN